MKYLFIIFLCVLVSIALTSQIPDNKLHIYICDVGQGDGILIVKGQSQIVIDAGPNNAIESCLGSHMPFWDRTIEVAIMTHADSDHSFGFIQMFGRYKIEHFLASPVDSNSHSSNFEELKKIVQVKNIRTLSAVAGKDIKVNGIELSVVFPNQTFFDRNSHPKESNTVLGSVDGVTNDFCAIVLLQYQKFTALFTCDTSQKSEEVMLSQNLVPHAYFLKVPHHGSKHGLTESFLKAVNPRLAAISVGVKNRYGHPNQEVLDMLRNFNIKTYRTDQDGEIEVKTDGEQVWAK